MKKKYIYIIFLLFSIIFVNISMFSQVKIGDTTPPADFSVLEIENLIKKGGLRIPQLTGVQSDQLKTYLSTSGQADKAIGLVIYNKEYNSEGGMVLYWDGTNWASAEALNVLQAGSGVTVLDPLSGGLKLGGALKEDRVDIVLDGNNLNFPLEGQNASFSVTNTGKDENTLIVKNGKVGMGGKDAPAKTLDINNTDPNLTTLKIEDGNESFGYLLASDRQGNASWQPLMALSSVVQGSVMVGSRFGAGTEISYVTKNTAGRDVIVTETATGDQDCSVTQKPLLLTEGKWLIVGKFTTMTTDVEVNDGNSSNQLLAYLSLRKSSKENPIPIVRVTESGEYSDIPLVITGALPSAKSYLTENRVNYYYGMPQVFYYADVTEEKAYFHLMANSSAKHQVISAYGNYFFALRIDGPQMTIAAEGTIDCSSLNSVDLVLKTNETIVNEPVHTVRIKLTNGSLPLEEGDIIGSENGIYLSVVEGPYEIKNDNVAVDVKVKIAGTVKSNVEGGSFRIPIKIAGVTFTNATCEGPMITVPTEGSLTCGSLSNLEIYTGRGKTLDILSDIQLNMVSGSIVVETGKVLAPTQGGINLTFNNVFDVPYYAPYPKLNLPVRIAGTVSNTATGQIKLVPVLSKTGITECTEGVTINVVIAQLDCGSTFEYPSNKSISATESINLQVDANSASYKLKGGQKLGSSSDITVTYVGQDLTLIPGQTHPLEVLISSGSNVRPVNEYTIPLNTLDDIVGLGIIGCDMKVKVMDYGYFGSLNVDIPRPEELAEDAPTTINESISIPLTFTESTKSVTINNGDILGSNNGYAVKVQTSDPIVINSAGTYNIPARLTGPIRAIDNSYTISLNKVPGIRTADVKVTFIAE